MVGEHFDTALRDPVLDSQSLFRGLLTAMSRPGEAVPIGIDFHAPSPLSPAAGALLLTLADLETPVWLDAGADTAAVRQLLRFGCACPVAASPSESAFAVITNLEQAPPLRAFNLGTDEYPDRSTTLIVDVQALHTDRGVQIEGPGIETPRRFGFDPCPDWFWAQALANHELYPRGVDVIFCCGASVAALPRSTHPTEL